MIKKIYTRNRLNMSEEHHKIYREALQKMRSTYTYSELSAKYNIDVNTLSKFFKGERYPTIEQALKIEQRSLGVIPRHLLLPHYFDGYEKKAK